MLVLQKLIQYGFKIITIGGGDPTSYPFWIELAEEAKSKGLFVHVDTNGIGLRINRDTASKVFQFVDLLGLPLDGPRAEVHDNVRSMVGHFDQILEKARWLKTQGVSLKLNTIVTRMNIETIPFMLDLVRELAPTRWSIYQYWPLSNGSRARLISDVDDRKFKEMIEELPLQLTETVMELNPRLSRRLTYPVVTHAGEVYVHSRENQDEFEFLGSIFENGTLDRAREMCAADRPIASTRYISSPNRA